MQVNVDDLNHSLQGIAEVEFALDNAVHPGGRKNLARLESAYSYLSVLKEGTQQIINETLEKPTPKKKASNAIPKKAVKKKTKKR